MKIISKINLITFSIILFFIDIGWLWVMFYPNSDIKAKLLCSIVFMPFNILLLLSNGSFNIYVDEESIRIRTPKKYFGYDTTIIPFNKITRTLTVDYKLLKFLNDTLYLICYFENGEEKAIRLLHYTKKDILRLFEFMKQNYNIQNKKTLN